MLSIAVLISGGGSNLQSILENIDSGKLKACEVAMVISDRENAKGLDKARCRNIPTYVVDRKTGSEKFSEEILHMVDGKVDLIVLAGFLSILKGDLLTAFKDRIINIHPSLIPAFCGSGMYGIKVHQAAIEAGVKYSGCTVHFVDEGTDTGTIIHQRIVPILEGDTPEDLQKRVLTEEHRALPEVIQWIAEERLKLIGKKACLTEKK